MSNFAGLLVVLTLSLAACKDTPSHAFLCHACTTDADCGGNPCYVDKSSTRYCGSPCDSCPAGFGCLPVAGSAGSVVQSCFPDNASCADTVVPTQNQDFAGDDLTGSLLDFSSAQIDFASSCAVPAGGTVGSTGGTVDRLYFGYTGDTRPSASTTVYPSSLQMVINNIFTQMGEKGVQFALDGGDHMEPTTATSAMMTQLGNYATAAGMLKKPVFMTMGNHECDGQFNVPQDCTAADATTSDARYAAYLSELKTLSGQSSAYYRFDVMTNSGKAVFIVIADDAWNSTQQAWLTAQLTDADATAKYTFVSKHHPDGNTDMPFFQDIYNLVTAHKYTLFLTGHSHEYKHPAADHRAVVMGLGGAPFDNPSQMWWGYLTIMQCTDDHIYVNVYDQSTGMLQDSFNVPPQ